MWFRANCIYNVIRNLAGSRRGGSAAEFAIVLPVFSLMMAGTVQYGVLFYTWNVALNGARSAARALAVGRTDQAGAEAMMLAALPPWVEARAGSGGSGGGDGDHDCGGGNGDPNDIGGYGQNGGGGCGAGNGNGNGNGTGNGVGNGNGTGNGVGNGNGGGGAGGILASATDAAVGGEVVAQVRFPSAIATVMALAPMPDNVNVVVRMVKEG